MYVGPIDKRQRRIFCTLSGNVLSDKNTVNLNRHTSPAELSEKIYNIYWYDRYSRSTMMVDFFLLETAEHVYEKQYLV